MNESQKVFNYGETQVRTVVKNEEVWFVGKDVAIALGYKHPSAAVAKKVNEEYKKKFKILAKGQGSLQLTSFISKEGLNQLIVSSRKSESMNLAEFLGIDMLGYKTTFKEQETLPIIKRSFSNLKAIEQFTVGNYRIDLYFPQYKIAIECDEFGHSGYKNEKEREDYIKEKLDCDFIRFNPDEKDFNIHDVVNRVFVNISNKLKSGLV